MASVRRPACCTWPSLLTIKLATSASITSTAAIELLDSTGYAAGAVSPLPGDIWPVHCLSAGMLYARSGGRWAMPGKRLGKTPACP